MTKKQKKVPTITTAQVKAVENLVRNHEQTLEQKITEELRTLNREDSVVVVEIIECILNILPQPNLVTLNHAVAAELSRQLNGGPITFGLVEGGSSYCGQPEVRS